LVLVQAVTKDDFGISRLFCWLQIQA